MVTFTKYYIDGIEYSGLEIVKIAQKFEWKGVDKTLPETKSVIQSAIDHLLIHENTHVITKITELGSIKESSVTPPAIRMIPRLPAPVKPVPVDNSVMTVYYTDAVYLVDTKLLGSECWNVQIFGSMICMQCPYRSKKTCYGEEVLSSAKNSLGHNIPMAVMIGTRPKRENGKEEVVK